VPRWQGLPIVCVDDDGHINAGELATARHYLALKHRAEALMAQPPSPYRVPPSQRSAAETTSTETAAASTRSAGAADAVSSIRSSGALPGAG
jgi:hypothetical protein